jgi:hypothetical protein
LTSVFPHERLRPPALHAGLLFTVTTHSEYVQTRYTHSALVFIVGRITKTHLSEHSSSTLRRKAARNPAGARLDPGATCGEGVHLAQLSQSHRERRAWSLLRQPRTPGPRAQATRRRTLHATPEENPEAIKKRISVGRFLPFCHSLTVCTFVQGGIPEWVRQYLGSFQVMHVPPCLH